MENKIVVCDYFSTIVPSTKFDNGYSVVKFHAKKGQKGEAGQDISDLLFTAVGYYLPVYEGIEYRLAGEWVKTEKFGLQFQVMSYEEIIQKTETGIKKYLTSGLIKGVGPKTADAIYAAFGAQTLDVMDNEPERLKEVPGIKDKTYEKIMTSYMSMRGARDIITLLTPHKVSVNKCLDVYRKWGAQAVAIIKENPYKLCDVTGIGFVTADKIGSSFGVDPLSSFRLSAGIQYALKEAESGGMAKLFHTQGHLCLTIQQLIYKAGLLLNTDGLTTDILRSQLKDMLSQGYVVNRQGYIFRRVTDKAEGGTAKNLSRIMGARCKTFRDLSNQITETEMALGCKLASEQREAVISTLQNSLTIVTGGPGTGKTMIQQIILKVYRKNCPQATVMLMAPTGRAARRMTESTGYPATTIHKALGLTITEDDDMDIEMLDADFIIVDEISMLDIFLSNALFKAIRTGTKVLLVGDSDQLPSVGPGAVLANMIESGCIPTVKLNTVYRQSGISLIALNAAKMRKACTEMEYGPEFVFVPANGFSDSAEIMERLYLEEIDKHGIDNVMVLCPYRTKTESGVDEINKRLQEIINPPKSGQLAVERRDKSIRQYDRVMITKNTEMLANGDIGCVEAVIRDEDSNVAIIDFGEGRRMECGTADLEIIELAYATTIHKSQGSESKVVITNILNGHNKMLKRNLLYTAVTRARQKVIIVGQENAITKAIKTEDTTKRQSLLSERIKYFWEVKTA